VSSDPDAAIIAHVIQLAVAPVFLLTGVAAFLAVMANRLARVIDRARLIEARWGEIADSARTAARSELAILARRAHLASWAINFSTFSALLICTVISTLFIDAFLGTRLKWVVGGFFVASMLALFVGLICFLREVYLATHTLRIGPPQ
jgi:mannose/fructose/N-acetylgalactosamine-specific phosphotransferase system component IIC